MENFRLKLLEIKEKLHDYQTRQTRLKLFYVNAVHNSEQSQLIVPLILDPFPYLLHDPD